MRIAVPLRGRIVQVGLLLHTLVTAYVLAVCALLGLRYYGAVRLFVLFVLAVLLLAVMVSLVWGAWRHWRLIEGLGVLWYGWALWITLSVSLGRAAQSHSVGWWLDVLIRGAIFLAFIVFFALRCIEPRAAPLASPPELAPAITDPSPPVPAPPPKAFSDGLED